MGAFKELDIIFQELEEISVNMAEIQRRFDNLCDRINTLTSVGK